MPWNTYPRVSDYDLYNFPGYKRYRNSDTYVVDTLRHFHGDALGYPYSSSFESFGSAYYNLPYLTRQNTPRYRSPSPPAGWRNDGKFPVPSSKNFGNSRNKGKYQEKRNFQSRARRQENCGSYQENKFNSHDEITREYKRCESARLESKMEQRYSPTFEHAQLACDFQKSRRSTKNIYSANCNYDRKTPNLEDERRNKFRRPHHYHENGSTSSVASVGQTSAAATDARRNSKPGSRISVSISRIAVSGGVENQAKEQLAQAPSLAARSSSSGVTSHSSSPVYTEECSSWYLPEEQEQIVEMLREVDLRHDRQLVHDILVLKGEISRSDDSFNSSGCDPCFGDVGHQRSMSSEEEEDGVIILLPVVASEGSPRQKAADLEQAAVSEAPPPEEVNVELFNYFGDKLLERARNDYFEDVPPFMDSPDKLLAGLGVKVSHKSHPEMEVVTGETLGGDRISPIEAMSQDLKSLLGIGTASAGGKVRVADEGVDIVEDMCGPEGMANVGSFVPNAQSSPKFSSEKVSPLFLNASTPDKHESESAVAYETPDKDVAGSITSGKNTESVEIPRREEERGRIVESNVVKTEDQLMYPTKEVNAKLQSDKEGGNRVKEITIKREETLQSAKVTNAKTKCKKQRQHNGTGPDYTTDTIETVSIVDKKQKISCGSKSYSSDKYQMRETGDKSFSKYETCETYKKRTSNVVQNEKFNAKFPKKKISPKMDESLQESKNEKHQHEIKSDSVGTARFGNKHTNEYSTRKQLNNASGIKMQNSDSTRIDTAQSFLYSKKYDSGYKRESGDEIFEERSSRASNDETYAGAQKHLLNFINDLPSEYANKNYLTEKEEVAFKAPFKPPVVSQDCDSLKRLLKIGDQNASPLDDVRLQCEAASQHLKQLLGIKYSDDFLDKEHSSDELSGKNMQGNEESHLPVYICKSSSSDTLLGKCNAKDTVSASPMSPFSGSISLPSVNYESSSDGSTSKVRSLDKTTEITVEKSQTVLNDPTILVGTDIDDSKAKKDSNVQSEIVEKEIDDRIIGETNAKETRIKGHEHGQQKSYNKKVVNKKSEENLRRNAFESKRNTTTEPALAKEKRNGVGGESVKPLGENDEGKDQHLEELNAPSKKKKKKKKSKNKKSKGDTSGESEKVGDENIRNDAQRSLQINQKEQKFNLNVSNDQKSQKDYGAVEDKNFKQQKKEFIVNQKNSYNDMSSSAQTYRQKNRPFNKQAGTNSYFRDNPILSKIPVKATENEKSRFPNDKNVKSFFNKTKITKSEDCVKERKINNENIISKSTSKFNPAFDNVKLKQQKTEHAISIESRTKHMGPYYQKKFSKLRDGNVHTSSFDTSKEGKISTNPIKGTVKVQDVKTKGIGRQNEDKVSRMLPSSMESQTGDNESTTNYKNPSKESFSNIGFLGGPPLLDRKYSANEGYVQRRKCYSSCELGRSAEWAIPTRTCTCYRNNNAGLRAMSLKQAKLGTFLKLKSPFSPETASPFQKCNACGCVGKELIVSNFDGSTHTVMSRDASLEDRPSRLDPVYQADANKDRDTSERNRTVAIVQKETYPTLGLLPRTIFGGSYENRIDRARKIWFIVKSSALIPRSSYLKQVPFSPVTFDKSSLQALMMHRSILSNHNFHRNVSCRNLNLENATSNIFFHTLKDFKDQRIPRKYFWSSLVEQANQLRSSSPVNVLKEGRVLLRRVQRSKSKAKNTLVQDSKVPAPCLTSGNTQASCNTRKLKDFEVDLAVKTWLDELENIYETHRHEWMYDRSKRST